MLGLNKAGFMLHSTIHEFRPELNCILHLHSPDVVAVRFLIIVYLYVNTLCSKIFLLPLKSTFWNKICEFNYLLNIFYDYSNVEICPFLSLAVLFFINNSLFISCFFLFYSAFYFLLLVIKM